MVRRLCDDGRYQAVSIGNLLCITRLQRCQSRKELALTVNKTKHIGHVAVRQLLVKHFLTSFLIFSLGLAPSQFLLVLVLFQVRQLALLEFAVEC